MPIEIIAPVTGSLLLGFFGWLKYRAYLKFMTHVVDKLADKRANEITAIGKIAKPGVDVASLPRRRLGSKQQQDGDQTAA